jgi:hypothetical protein
MDGPPTGEIMHTQHNRAVGETARPNPFERWIESAPRDVIEAMLDRLTEELHERDVRDSWAQQAAMTFAELR